MVSASALAAGWVCGKEVVLGCLLADRLAVELALGKEELSAWALVSRLVRTLARELGADWAL